MVIMCNNEFIINKLRNFVSKTSGIVYAFISGSLAEGKSNPRDVDLTIVVKDWNLFHQCMNKCGEFENLRKIEQEIQKPIDLHCCVINEVINFLTNYFTYRELAFVNTVANDVIWASYVYLDILNKKEGEKFYKLAQLRVPIRRKYILLKW